jgi:hypothetical protein
LFHTLPHHSFCGLHKTFPEVFCFHNLHTHIALVSSTLFDNNSTTLMQRFISPINFNLKCVRMILHVGMCKNEIFWILIW